MMLQNGDTANWKIWQAFLNTQGFSLTVDGDPGPATERATRAFQTAHGLRADGMVGDLTIAAAKTLGFAGFEVIAPVLVEKAVTIPADSHLAMFDGTRVNQINAAMMARLCPSVQTRVSRAIGYAYDDGTELQIVQGLRTFTEQDGLYAQGRTKPGKIVTNARGGQSMHNYGIAVDLAPVVNGEPNWDEKLYAPYAGWAAKAGLEWGGSWTHFKDLPHMQDVNGMSLGQVQGLYRQGGLAAVWAHVN